MSENLMHVDLESRDVAWCVRRLPPTVKNLLLANGASVFVAGGFIRACITGEPVVDVDLFVPTGTDVNAHVRAMGADPDAAIRTDNAVTIQGTPPVQIIHRWTYEKPEQALDAFDFTIARAVLWYGGPGVGWRGLCDLRYYADLAAKRLIYCNPPEDNAGGSFLRLLKFGARGYRAPLDDLGLLLSRVVGDLPLSGTHAERAAKITQLLREVDPLPEAQGASVPTAPKMTAPMLDEDEEVSF